MQVKPACHHKDGKQKKIRKTGKANINKLKGIVCLYVVITVSASVADIIGLERVTDDILQHSGMNS